MHIELIATDSRIQKRVLWVDITSNGVYSGHCFESSDRHVSYHFDGNVNHNWAGEKPERTRVLPSLEELRGQYQLYTSGFTNDPSRLHNTPLYYLKKLDAIVNVDMRVYKKGVGCHVFIIEQNRFDLIGEVMSGVEGLPTTLSPTEGHIFLRCNPWIALVLYGNFMKED